MAVYSACYFMKEGDSLWLSNLYVDDNYRGSGVAKKMMEKLSAIAKDNGYHLICFLEDADNQAAKKFAFKSGAKISDNLRLFFIEL